MGRNHWQYFDWTIRIAGTIEWTTFLEFLQNAFRDLIEPLPLETRLNMYFLHDGAPPHFSVAVREHLNNVYPNRWIGRGGPIDWPPRFPDLRLMDFFLWGYLKKLGVFHSDRGTSTDNHVLL